MCPLDHDALLWLREHAPLRAALNVADRVTALAADLRSGAPRDPVAAARLRDEVLDAAAISSGPSAARWYRVATMLRELYDVDQPMRPSDEQFCDELHDLAQDAASYSNLDPTG
jgi:hypothetical protein